MWRRRYSIGGKRGLGHKPRYYFGKQFRASARRVEIEVIMSWFIDYWHRQIPLVSCEQLRFTMRYKTARAGWRAMSCIRECLCQCKRGVVLAKALGLHRERVEIKASASWLIDCLDSQIILAWCEQMERTKGSASFALAGVNKIRRPAIACFSPSKWATNNYKFLATQTGDVFLFLRVFEGGSFLFKKRSSPQN